MRTPPSRRVRLTPHNTTYAIRPPKAKEKKSSSTPLPPPPTINNGNKSSPAAPDVPAAPSFAPLTPGEWTPKCLAFPPLLAPPCYWKWGWFRVPDQNSRETQRQSTVLVAQVSSFLRSVEYFARYGRIFTHDVGQKHQAEQSPEKTQTRNTTAFNTRTTMNGRRTYTQHWLYSETKYHAIIHSPCARKNGHQTDRRAGKNKRQTPPPTPEQHEQQARDRKHRTQSDAQRLGHQISRHHLCTMHPK